MSCELKNGPSPVFKGRMPRKGKALTAVDLQWPIGIPAPRAPPRSLNLARLIRANQRCRWPNAARYREGKCSDPTTVDGNRMTRFTGWNDQYLELLATICANAICLT
jgi:hypothetical protein